MGLSTWVRKISSDRAGDRPGTSVAPITGGADSGNSAEQVREADSQGSDGHKATDVDSQQRWVGYIDRVGRDAIEGWAYDTYSLESSVVVEALANNGKRSLAVANLYRKDVEEAGFGTGRYGFVLSIGALDLKDETVIVRFLDSKHLITRVPIEFDSQRALLTNDMPSAYGDEMILLAGRVRQAYEAQAVPDEFRG